MAAPITHIVLTHKIFDKYFSDKDPKKFYVGTSFPDIRYMGVIDREKTHYKDLRITDIAKEASFVAGLKFHSFLDVVREKFVLSNNIYDRLPKSPYVTQALKFYEDEILYDYITGWDNFISYFDQVLDEERSFGIAYKDLEQWHKILNATFSTKPTPHGVAEFVRMIGRPKEMSDEIERIVNVIRTDALILEYVRSLYTNFDKLILEEI